MINQKIGINTNEFKIQDDQYNFPYHYIPFFDLDGTGNRLRIINNGFEYLCYVKHVVDFLNKQTDGDTLEVGCGDGRVINFLNNDKAIGVDLSSKAIEFAKVFNPENLFICGDANDINEKFSFVLAIEVLEHIPDEIIPIFWKTLHNRCSINGRIIISVPTKNKRLIPKHFRHYDINRIQEEIKLAGLNSKLKVETVQYIYRENWLIRIWKRFTNNRFWTFEIHSFKKFMWNYIWNKHRIVDSNEGFHLFASFIKIDD